MAAETPLSSLRRQAAIRRLAVAFALFACGHQALADTPSLQELSRQAAEAARGGRIKEAVRLYDEWVDLDPLNPLARASRGAAYFQDERWADARKELERAVLIEPKLASSWATLGLLYDRAGEDWLALSAYTRAVHLEPRVARHRILLALAMEKRGWTDAAESALMEAASLDPESADARFNLAALALRRTPPAVETARRNYAEARRLGAPADPDIDAMLAEGKSSPDPRSPANTGKKKNGKK